MGYTHSSGSYTALLVVCVFISCKQRAALLWFFRAAVVSPQQHFPLSQPPRTPPWLLQLGWQRSHPTGSVCKHLCSLRSCIPTSVPVLSRQALPVFLLQNTGAFHPPAAACQGLCFAWLSPWPQRSPGLALIPIPDRRSLSHRDTSAGAVPALGAPENTCSSKGSLLPRRCVFLARQESSSDVAGKRRFRAWSLLWQKHLAGALKSF